jgi:PPP family 3-phenylpropionic acid transporter
MNNQTKTLNIKYAFIQGFYYITNCCIQGYAAVYLGAIGLSSTMIGLILALGNIVTTFGSPVLASFVDKFHWSVNKVLMILGFLSGILSLMLVASAKLPVLVAVLFVILFGLLNMMMPLINALSFAFEEHGININFGVGRGIGSAAYAFTSLGLGYLVQTFSPVLMPWVLVAVLTGLIPLIQSFRMNEEVETAHEEEETSSIKDFCKEYTTFMIFLLGFMMVYADHMIINNFFINIIRNVGAGTSQMGVAVFLAAILELISMSAFEKFKNKIDITIVLKIAAVMFTVKHVLTYFASSMTVIYIAQVMQMFAYALFIPAAVYYVDKLFNKKDAIKGQSLVTTAMTASGIISSLVGGILFDSVGTSTTLLIGAIVSLLGTIIMIMTTQKVN